jgi:putative DNA methylase
MNYRKKLIEVALPLEAINKESAREKSIRHGHPSTLHLWWARRPLAACRAVLFASLVDDPSSHPDKFPTEEAQEKERKRLFQIIENLVKWDNVNNQQVLDAAKAEILKSTDNNPPPVYDPFCGGGSIPLEAQRLGLEAHGSDLNPVAVLITKALIEIPPKFKDRPPVNPEAQQKLIPPAPLHKGGAAGGGIWYGAQGLAEDVRYYGKWMRDEAEKRIGHLYPKVKLPTEYGGGEATVIAWLWARTVQCPNPACGAKMPLVRSFALSTKKGKEAWVEPAINRDSVPHIVSFEVKTGKGKAPDGTVSRKGAVCICCGKPVAFDYIRSEGKAGRMSAQLMAIVAEGNRSRLYLASTEEHIEIADSAQPEWKPDTDLPEQALGFRVQGYGMTKHADLFTSRQLVALTTFSDLVSEAREKIILNAVAAGMPDDSLPLCEGGTGATGYADAVATYLAFVISKIPEASSTICTWSSSPKNELVVSTFRRQAIPMTRDFAEAIFFGISSGSVVNIMQFIAKVVIDFPDLKKGIVKQSDATAVMIGAASSLISTDPPYYDNIVSADLSDFFYVWLGRSLDKRFPNVISTLLTPKAQELVATPYRFGGNKQKAKEFFEEGLGKAFARMRETANPEYPLTVYYAFKQSETEDDEDENQVNSAIASTGWETMLEGLIKAGFSINGTWPMRTELSNRTVASGTNALASSIVLVCRPRPETAPSATRRQFLNELKRELPDALHTLQQGNIAPVDLAQASIGPGMAIYSRYSQVLEADGTPMRVRTALQLINQTLDEYLSEQEGEFDADTRWALTWFEQNQYKEGLYGDAETLSKAKNTSVSGLVTGGILTAKGGKVRLLRRDELPENWNPATDNRTSDWEATQYLIRTLDQKGESGTAALLAQLGDRGEVARDLAYRLYNICDRKGWTSEAIGYNSLVISWSEITRLAVEQQQQPVQMTFDF